jgi:integrase
MTKVERHRLVDDSVKRLTDVGSVGKLPAPANGNRIYYDAEDGGLAGFGVRVTAAGARSFILNYRTKGGRERRITIGTFPNWTIGAARIKAREFKRLVEDGGDPLKNIEDEREADTMADLADRFEKEHLPRKRDSTKRNYQLLLRLHVRPHFKRTKVADVTFADIDSLHRKITKTGSPYAANRTIAVLSKMFSLAIRWKMRSDNPCRGIERNTEYKRTRYLSSDELRNLVAALAGLDRQTANAIRLLLLTGSRRGEVLAMRWADIDLSAGTWSKQASSVKQDKPHEVPLSAPVRQLLSEIAGQAGKRPLGEFVFPGAGSTGHVVEIKKAWRTLCKNAKISSLRINDLRHSFASELVSGGASLPLIGALLGHSNPATTQRYAHLFLDPQRAAVERVGAVVGAAGKAPPPKPTPLPDRRRSRR